LIVLIFTSTNGFAQIKGTSEDRAISYLEVCLEISSDVYVQKYAEEDESRRVALTVVAEFLNQNCLSVPTNICVQAAAGSAECLQGVDSWIEAEAENILEALPEEISAPGFSARRYPRILNELRLGIEKDTNCQPTPEYPERICDHLDRVTHLYMTRYLMRLASRYGPANGEN